MIDPFSLLGAVAAAAQLSKYGLSFARKVIECPGDLRDAPREVHNLLVELEGFLEIAQSISTHICSSSHHNQLKALASACIDPAQSLQHTLRSLIATDTDTKIARLIKASLLRIKARKIEKTLIDIQRRQGNLQLQLTAGAFRFVSPDDTIDRACHADASQPSYTEGFLVDIPRNVNFIGRQSTVDAIDQVIRSTSALRRIALVGLAGIGKSQVALHVAYRTKEWRPNSAIFWVDASSELVFRLGFARIRPSAKNLSTVQSAVADSRTWLESSGSGNWVLILDALDLQHFGDIEALHKALPHTGQGTIIFTTRNQRTASELVEASNILSMNAMSRVDARSLLELHIGNRLDVAQEESTVSSLHCHPQAIVQAATYLRDRGISLNEYLHHLEPSVHSTFFDKLIQTAFAQWFKSVLTMVAGRNERYMQLVYCLAFLGEASVPWDLLSPIQVDDQSAEELGMLEAYSLITRTQGGECVLMSPMVREVVRRSTCLNGDFSSGLRLVFELLVKTYPKETYDRATLEKAKSYSNHVTSLWALFETLSQSYGQMLLSAALWEQLAYAMSRYLTTIGQYAAAMKYAQSAVSGSKEAYGNYSKRHSKCLCNMATLYQHLGQMAHAASSTQAILMQQTYLSTQPSVEAIAVYNEAALVLQLEGRYQEAEEYHLHAIAASELLWGTDHPETLDVVHNLGLCYFHQQRYEEALDVLQNVGHKMTAAHGPEHLKTFAALDSLADILQRVGRWDEALQIHTAVLSSREALLGLQHPDTMSSKANLAEDFRRRGDLSGAESLTREALEYYKDNLGREHPATMTCMGNLSILLRCQRRYEEAAEIGKDVVKLRRTKLGVEHPDTVLSMCDLSVIYQCNGRYCEALRVGTEALEIRRRNLHEDHPDRIASEKHVPQLQEDYDEWLMEQALV
ncbi:hypothetical protein BDV96DRAFT_2573 [Lophiotrema nucula]|uniref:TPR-like protein n=1 Tax=Lophiotrema nucula TaxID=690887 RepID=A0A6A5ZTL0_9PLEO|nr:hypothetical protein BDV96DRAFT_2573 [Lophiotrema nucula]